MSRQDVMIRVAFLLLGMGPWYGSALADDEASNRPYVTASEGGQFYARSIPAESYGLRGRTEIYRVAEKDRLLHTYDWYSPRLFLEGRGEGSVTVIQMGPWHRGHQATKEALALAIHRDGALLRRYSTLDIAGAPDNVSASVSHYVVFEEIHGIRADRGGLSWFETRTTDGRTLTFDLEDGTIVTPEQMETKRMLREAGDAIGNLKYKWYEKNRAAYEKNKKIRLTKAMLVSVSNGSFPKLPPGYEYVPGEVWGPPSFKRIERRR